MAIAGSAGAVDDHLDLVHLLVYDLQRVGQTCQRDHGGAMLVIMENGDVTAFLQLLLNLKAAGSGNVLQIYTAEGACQQRPRC